MKQNLQIKTFVATTENAVISQCHPEKRYSM